MFYLTRPPHFDPPRLQALCDLRGIDSSRLRWRQGRLAVPDDIALTQADLDSCVTPAAEVFADSRRNALAPGLLADIATLVDALGSLAWDTMDSRTQDACREARQRIAEYTALEKQS